jgi:hypothetical protein
LIFPAALCHVYKYSQALWVGLCSAFSIVHFAKYFLATFPRIDLSSRDVPAALNHKIKKEMKKEQSANVIFKIFGSFPFNSLNHSMLIFCQQSVYKTPF